jgi:hypothetical protein
MVAVSDPRPSPKPVDEARALELRHLVEDAVLRAVPNGEERCENCRTTRTRTTTSYAGTLLWIWSAALVVPVVGPYRLSGPRAPGG